MPSFKELAEKNIPTTISNVNNSITVQDKINAARRGLLMAIVYDRLIEKYGEQANYVTYFPQYNAEMDRVLREKTITSSLSQLTDPAQIINLARDPKSFPASAKPFLHNMALLRSGASRNACTALCEALWS